MIDVQSLSKNVDTYAPVDVNDQLHEQETSLQRPYRNVASIKQFQKDSLNVSILCDNAFDVTSCRYSSFQGEMTIPIFQFRDSSQFIHRKMREQRF